MKSLVLLFMLVALRVLVQRGNVPALQESGPCARDPESLQRSNALAVREAAMRCGRILEATELIMEAHRRQIERRHAAPVDARAAVRAHGLLALALHLETFATQVGPRIYCYCVHCASIVLQRLRHISRGCRPR